MIFSTLYNMPCKIIYFLSKIIHVLFLSYLIALLVRFLTTNQRNLQPFEWKRAKGQFFATVLALKYYCFVGQRKNKRKNSKSEEESSPPFINVKVIITLYTINPGLGNLYFYTLRKPNIYKKSLMVSVWASSPHCASVCIFCILVFSFLFLW